MKVSVCMATYDGAKYLRDQIDSVLGQLAPGDELLVADDGSSDQTYDVLESYGDHLKITHTNRVGGVVANFERVLAVADGDAILLADQDDVWLPGRVNLMRRALSKYDLVLVNAEIVDETLSPTGSTLFDQLGRRRGLVRNLWRNTFVGCCLGIRRSLLQHALPFPSGLPWHDWYLGLLAESRGRIWREERIYGYYRRHGDNVSATGLGSDRSMCARLEDRIRMLRALAVARLR